MSAGEVVLTFLKFSLQYKFVPCFLFIPEVANKIYLCNFGMIIFGGKKLCFLKGSCSSCIPRSQWSRCWCGCPALPRLCGMVWSLPRLKGLYILYLYSRLQNQRELRFVIQWLIRERCLFTNYMVWFHILHVRFFLLILLRMPKAC